MDVGPGRMSTTIRALYGVAASIYFSLPTVSATGLYAFSAIAVVLLASLGIPARNAAPAPSRQAAQPVDRLTA